MPAENRDVRGNEIKPAVMEVSESFTDPGGVEHTGKVGGIWEEDANSPLELSNESSGTLTLAGTYDAVMCIVTSGSGAYRLDIRINGDTAGNYDYVDESGSLSTSAAAIQDAITAGYSVGQQITMSGSWNNEWGVNVGRQDANAGGAATGKNGNVTSPLDSITLFEPSGNPVSLTMRVYGI